MTPPDPAIDLITKLATRLLAVSDACICAASDDPVWLESIFGAEQVQTNRVPGLLSAVADVDEFFHVSDVSKDANRAALEAARPGIRFCAGAPLRAKDGRTLGYLCVMDEQARGLSEDERAILTDLAQLAVNEIEGRRARLDLERAQAALRESEALFRGIFEQAAVGIAQIDVQGRFLKANNRLCEILGYDRDELMTLCFQEITHPEDLAHNLVDQRRALAGEVDGYDLEKRYIRKDGTSVTCALYARLVRDEAGEPRYFIAAVEDISQRRRTEEALRRTEEQMRHVQKLESLGVLAGGIAHDFNNLLVGILGNAGLVLADLARTSPAWRHVKTIENTAQRAAELTNQMLAYSGKGSFVVGTVDLNQLVADTRELLGMAVAKHVELRYDLAPRAVLVEGDVTQLRQVLVNCVTNASDAIGDDHGSISIRTGEMEATREYLAGTYLYEELPPGPYAYFEIRDTGTGMDEDTLRRIFDPFFTTKFTGRGLGLAAVLGIVRRHKGAISIRSTPGEGSAFCIMIPSIHHELSPESPAEREAEMAWRGKGTVLVVDDEEIVRNLATATLERAGFDVVTANDGVEGVEAFVRHAADLVGVLLDVTMPTMSGEDAYERIRDHSDEVPVLFSSGYNEQNLADRLACDRALDFIKKPYRPAELVRKLRALMGAVRAD